MSFAQDMAHFKEKTERNFALVQDGVDAEVFRSVVHGSEITASPGQPYDPDPDPNAGKLRDSWVQEKLDERTTVTYTDVVYAPKVEENVEGVHFRTGGPHSKKLTEAGFPRIVDIVAQQVASA